MTKKQVHASRPNQSASVPPYVTRGPLLDKLETATENRAVSKKQLRELAQQFGSKETQKAVRICIAELEEQRAMVHQQINSFYKHMGVLFGGGRH
jgi:hypothetical protein